MDLRPLGIILLVSISYLIVNDYRRNIPIHIIVVQISSMSLIQIIWSIVYMIALYPSLHLTTFSFFIINVGLTILTIQKGYYKTSYWILTNFLMSPIVSMIWISIDKSAFEGGVINGLESALTPIALPFFNFICQIIILLCIEFYKWITQYD
ncbi:MAG: hypothetical protein L0F95_03695 [Lactococcus sp.]|nr:hypothetical protein [Lactococcus sp.]SOB46907.1 membrane hypothetical protein [Lactococcus piscium]MDN5409461.1 hypothetical protein [Lactococcus sp.]MDN5411505.1 hypothetical protein [Lactococcus sp.]MDN5436744.1 hypothetical protein [Lactococcus sp.]MDN5461189.1 hypothetical protein [Lactococcus sp.]